MNDAQRAALIQKWSDPSSTAEQDRQDRAERMIRDAIDDHPAFAETKLTIYAKGSYANNTNVRLDSDVDIVVECRACIYYGWHEDVQNGEKPAPYQGPWTTERWRTEVETALVNKFGRSAVNATGAVAIVVAEQPGSRPSADVVPSFAYRKYMSPDRAAWDDGSTVFTRSGKQIVNWPEQQLANGRAKNQSTGQRYKKYVRVLKNAENCLVENGIIEAKPSYMMECLMWNVPNLVMEIGTIADGFKASLGWAYTNLTSKFDPAAWEEPNRLKQMFGSDQKWTREDAEELVVTTRELLFG